MSLTDFANIIEGFCHKGLLGQSLQVQKLIVEFFVHYFVCIQAVFTIQGVCVLCAYVSTYLSLFVWKNNSCEQILN